MASRKFLLTGAIVVCVTLISNTALVSKANEEHNHREHQHKKKADTNTETTSGSGHHHQKVEIPAGKPVPSVDLVVYKDAVKGWNLQLKTDNFVFAPENVNKDSKLTEGHAHLFVNGKKITRLYSSWYHLDNLQPGENKVTVTLNTNKHEDLFYQGKKIQDTEAIKVEQ
ncbi:MAG: hypothetical protein AAF208_08260 [Cyanobacteria bacterium P01_A01_bin.45]